MVGVIVYYKAVSELLCFPCVLLGWWHLHSPGPGTMFEDKSGKINPKVMRCGIHLIKYRHLHYTYMVFTHHHQLSLQSEMKSKHFCGVSQAAISCGQRNLVLEGLQRRGNHVRDGYLCYSYHLRPHEMNPNWRTFA